MTVGDVDSDEATGDGTVDDGGARVDRLIDDISRTISRDGTRRDGTGEVTREVLCNDVVVGISIILF
jgi:hypothetical protein